MDVALLRELGLHIAETNDEARMTNDKGNPNAQMTKPRRS